MAACQNVFKNCSIKPIDNSINDHIKRLQLYYLQFFDSILFDVILFSCNLLYLV
jgi:hypothetical protein